MVQRLRFFHKCGTPRLVHPLKQIYVFLATAPTGILTAATAGNGEGVAYLWSLCLIMSKKRELLYFAGRNFFTLKYIEPFALHND